jgi:hypothetical protein
VAGAEPEIGAPDETAKRTSARESEPAFFPHELELIAELPERFGVCLLAADGLSEDADRGDGFLAEILALNSR